MNLQECIKKIDDIIHVLRDIPGCGILQLYVEPEDIEALVYARNKLMSEEDDLR